ncbi:MAG: EcoRV family type II restriction endonuclease [bacterium]|nr:EcoRV family type II restriction endonuclease [Candidatus Limimorpha equi]
MTKDEFLQLLQQEAASLQDMVATANGDWIVKGFIDVSRNIYTISADTKVISKIMELLIFPRINEFASRNGLEWQPCSEQNFYPDITFIDNEGNKFAVDVKSTYRKDAEHVNGMTLGAFTGYFRNRNSTKNIMFPYNEYAGHFVLGLIYSRCDGINEGEIHQLDDLQNIQSVAKDFVFFAQEKYKIAIDRPGSGNTKNIGGVTKIENLINGNGLFSTLGESVFDDYWMYYLTSDMANAAQLPAPYYKNIEEYRTFKGI